MKKSFLALFLILTLASQSIFAEGTISVGGMTITGGGITLIGSVVTTTADSRNKSVVGWVLIVVGTLVADGNLKFANAAELSGNAVWKEIVQEATVLTKLPSLAKPDAPIVNAAQELEVSTQKLAAAVLSIEAEAQLARLQNREVDFESVQEKLFPQGATQKQISALKNMSALASMI